MTEAVRKQEPPGHDRIDQRVVLHGVPWSQYEALLETRGERAGVRITYLEGELELMTPSRDHESIKKLIARLLEAWGEETATDLNGIGSWTLKSALKERGLEPDECYVLADRETDVPDLAIEVVWTAGGIAKLDVYRGLGVPEVWFWRSGKIEIHVLSEGHYDRAARSRLLPAIDLELLAHFTDRRNQAQAVREYRAALRARSG